MELAGDVDAVGEGVSGFAVGDPVFGSTGLKFGANAEYVCAPQSLLAAKPADVPYERAAPVAFGGISALHYLRAAGLQAGQKLLVYGASGSVGTAAVQLGKHFGAHVTGVCSRGNLDLVRSLGADTALDYAVDDYSRGGAIYDVVFDTVGKSDIKRGIRALKRGGAYAFAVMSLVSYARVKLSAALTGRIRVIDGIARVRSADLAFLMQLIRGGSFTPVVDRMYPLGDIVAAHTYVDAGHKTGNVVVLVN